jgi:hypothetical protein
MFNFDSPFGSSIFCDDIRYEIGGKTSLIGVYHGVMYVREFPADIAKLGITIFFNEPREMAEKRTFNLKLKIFSPNSDDEPLINADIMPLSREQIENISESSLDNDPDIPKLVMLKAEFTLSPLKIEKPGRMKVRMAYGEDIIKIGSMKIELQPNQAAFNPSPSAPEPLSARSPLDPEPTSSLPEPSRPGSQARRRRS